ncbi:hypothetical protein BU16DRAFT_581665 [Lophium mytilinum]|uniref:Uncharacterized protein n=1 Tax=Lophium mytilinum TaxID=390894 RepID=A0A6A6QXB5_9PEZI|nr:hypothetical protein BU16DRAFT_581665 [Lophium mytilinum]
MPGGSPQGPLSAALCAGLGVCGSTSIAAVIQSKACNKDARLWGPRQGSLGVQLGMWDGDGRGVVRTSLANCAGDLSADKPISQMHLLAACTPLAASASGAPMSTAQSRGVRLNGLFCSYPGSAAESHPRSTGRFPPDV